ncbi:hypothetical protein [Actinacidiphila oryziradicis]|uniref:Uncharacterized protein n=1 Tax=Actinacidiphila oryziradicis TaxID=2571141 RepID=A0A4U0RU04_9ACTN|nr:hypothetical protein [Actinacidiphila oryziradicis]TJZ99589.1 hypothetical protein FCI23_45070 [Actinacidiphila oryziradicis]
MLSDARRLLGPDDPIIPVISGNIAYWLGQAGVPADAAATDANRLRAQHPDSPYSPTAFKDVNSRTDPVKDGREA